MNEIGSKIIFVGFPMHVHLDDPPCFFEALKKHKIFSFPDNHKWEMCRHRIEKNHLGLCEFISYDEFTVMKTNFFKECKMLIFFSSLDDFHDIQEDEWLFPIKHFNGLYKNSVSTDWTMGSPGDVWKLLFLYKQSIDPFQVRKLDSPESTYSIKDQVHKKIDCIQKLKNQCKFCIMPMSSECYRHKSIQLDSVRTIKEVLNKHIKIDHKDLVYFNILLSPFLNYEPGVSWRNNLKFSYELSTPEYICLTTYGKCTTELYILPKSNPEVFEKNIDSLLSEMGYYGSGMFNAYKELVEDMYSKNNARCDFPIIGNSHELTDLYNNLSLLKSHFEIHSEGTHVFITGESGVGKEHIAQIIGGYYTKVAGKDINRFVTIDCSVISETLAISQIFGHIGGIATDVTNDKPGLIQEDVAVIFLDEIHALGDKISAMLLRFMQEGNYFKLGEEGKEKGLRQSKCKIIGATNRKKWLTKNRNTGLPQRFQTVLNVPSLNQRREDIKLLVRHFYDEFWINYKSMKKVSTKKLSLYDPPWDHIDDNNLQEWKNKDWTNDNIRILKNEVIREIEIYIRDVELKENAKILPRGPGNPGKEIDIIEFVQCLVTWNPKNRKEFIEFWQDRHWDRICKWESALRDAFSNKIKSLRKSKKIKILNRLETRKEIVKNIISSCEKEKGQAQGFHDELTKIRAHKKERLRENSQLKKDLHFALAAGKVNGVDQVSV